MALFRNLGVKQRDRLCDVPRYASAQSLVFLDLAKNCSFLNWKLTLVPSEFLQFMNGHKLTLLNLGLHPNGSNGQNAIVRILSNLYLVFG